ncbi:hypothetical protein BM613_07265 [Sulfoacidibacillus thermotolerans]|uniref:Uncharacterized protein n=2 Tax=Sulfoacidibacillus thermotolerans TaxID=1765684 RepID=A0A2U3D923_SULT2|nr:hypothetical protein BM613_07265 [Sulfoacidibacillus thermotolerans]
MRMWKLRDIVVAAILSVVCGAIYMGWDWITNPLFASTMSPIVGALVNGLWWIAAGLVPYIIRRPGAAFFSEVVSACVEFLFGSPYSLGAVISGLVQGAGSELGFALWKWRRYDLIPMLVAGALGGVGNSIQWYFEYQGDQYSIPVIIGYTLVTMLSGAILAGALPKWIGDALLRTGTLRNFEIAKQRR